MHLQLGEVSAIVVSSPKVAEQIIKTHDLSFVDREELLTVKILTYGYKDVAFAPYGDYWRQMKKIFTLELLSARRVQSFRSLREKESAFGQKCEENEELLSLMNQVVNMASGFDIADIFPSLKFLHIISGMKPKLYHLFHKVDKILETIIRKHLEHRAAFKDHNIHEVKENLLDVLLRVQKLGEVDFPITNESIKAVMVEIFSAGTDTSSSTTKWAMSEMLKNPRVMAKAQAEVRRVMNIKGKIDESEL
ncbi:cytochrome P450 71D8-like [Papaver somniferum]|uniref:cytochrome P450 71D8-like n=1 Tax=Papaver somniferum TaxID=3469 RepID=UPI000E6FB5F5|nr:cytochrome P450 71D8-like [Papaver somniferum]